jgi:DNA-binding transcriptional ArsR family regulator
MHPLEALDWRIERANEHLATLNDERSAFLARLEKQNPRIVGEFDRNTSEYVFRVNCDPPKASLGIVVSELSHHLRATLDNLLWQLVLLRGGAPTSKTQFPIYESRKRYESSVWMLRGISADDRAFIESVQPFQLGERSADSSLAALAWLNNVDKHRFIHVSCARPRLSAISVSYGTEGEYAGQFPWYPRFVKDVRKILRVTYVTPATSNDRTELMRVLIETNGPDPQMKMDGDEPVEIAVSDTNHPLMFPGLGVVSAHVAWIVKTLRPRFDV